MKAIIYWLPSFCFYVGIENAFCCVYQSRNTGLCQTSFAFPLHMNECKDPDEKKTVEAALGVSCFKARLV